MTKYAITQEAMDVAIKAEEYNAYVADITEQILSDPDVDAAYRAAKERIEVAFTAKGNIGHLTYIKKNGERSNDERAAWGYITKCGLSHTEFIVKAKHDTPSADIADAETAEVIPVEKFWCEVEIADLSEQDAADIVAHFHGQDGANKFFKMRATELDGSEEDIDGDNIFDYLPALDELNDVDIVDDDNTPPDSEPMSDDISDICKYVDDVDDNKPVRLDWDDSATFIDERTDEEELAGFNALPEIPAGTLEPVIYDGGKMYTKEEFLAKLAAEKSADKPAKFEVGKTYYARSACDYDCIFTFKVIARTAKTVTLEDNRGTTKKRKIIADNSGNESCMPQGNYSMAPCLYATADYATITDEIPVATSEDVINEDEAKTKLDALIERINNTDPREYTYPVTINTPTFKTTTGKNGKTLYYIDGKRRSEADYKYQLEQRQGLIDELPHGLAWLNYYEPIFEDAKTLESVSGVERDEIADVKRLADSYIAIDGATVQSVEVKQVGRSNSYYIDGKRTSRDKALDACATIRGDNHFTIEYQRGRYGDDGKIVYSTERKTMSRLDLKINAHGDGYSVHFYTGFATVHIFEEYEDAKACFNQIEAAFIAGKAGVKVDSDGTVSDLDTFNRRTEEIGDDLIVWHGDEWHGTYSLKYDADFFKGIRSGKLHYRVGARVVSEQEFWAAMIERGACTIDLTDAEKLTAKLKEVTRKARLMEIYPQVGGRIVDTLYKVKIVPDGGGFIFTNGHETFARYDTEEQCLEIIRQIGVAVEFGDSSFTFPKAADIELELNLPALAAAHLQTYGLTLAESCGYPEAYHA